MASAFPHWQFTLFQEFPARKWKSYLKGKLRRWKKEPLSLPIQTIAILLGRLRQPLARVTDSPVRLWRSLEDVALSNVQYLRVRGLHHKDTLRRVSELKPWLGISIGAPILKRSLFALPERGTINIHKSYLPAYRGAPPGFWELYDGVTTSGVSIHWVEDGLDTGPIITQELLRIPRFSTPMGLAAELDLLGTRVLLEALRLIDSRGGRGKVQKGGDSKTNRQPPWLLVDRLRRRTWRRRTRAANTETRFVQFTKDIILRFYVSLFARLRNWYRGLRGRCHTTILLYHRIDDNRLDSLTVGLEQFTQHLRCLARHYDIVDLRSFLAGRGVPRKRPAVVITFDDGYENNLLAAVLLRRSDIPATFFISTRIVGSDQAFPHDLEHQHEPGLSSLSWGQVRQMASWGFSVSNHTARHVNLGRISTEVAVNDIATARDDLLRELGERESARWLAYPYGKREDITEEVRQGLPSMGVTHCFSAYGGTNPPEFEPYNILRQGVDHNMNKVRLRATVEGWVWRATR
jgi:peptidoglycan/xylan/chitin deacetylase (PgdA/CDA1 family)